MPLPSSLISSIRIISFAILLFFAINLNSNATDSSPIEFLGKLKMTPSSMSWSVKKVGQKIVASNRMTKQKVTVSQDSEEEGDVFKGSDQRYQSRTNYEIVSLVGPVLSICRSYYSDTGARPSYGTEFEVVNLDKGKEEISLTDIFDESEVLTALLKDKVIRKAIGNSNPKNLKEVESAEGGCEMDFSEMNRSFAFHHIKGNDVAVRIGLRHGCEAMRGMFTQIGIYLPLSKTTVFYFKQSDKNRMLMRHLWTYK